MRFKSDLIHLFDVNIFKVFEEKKSHIFSGAMFCFVNNGNYPNCCENWKHFIYISEWSGI